MIITTVITLDNTDIYDCYRGLPPEELKLEHFYINDCDLRMAHKIEYRELGTLRVFLNRDGCCV